ncbi:MAG: sigma-54-dependent transcriptional regulator [Gemmatimonadota bacterium]
MAEGRTARILVADDDRAFRLSTIALLQQDGYDVLSAADGSEAIDTVRRAACDLLLLDLRMPGPDGLSVVERLRREGERVPILMISGFGTVDCTVRALHLGADDFLMKPVEPDVLSSRVAELLERRPVLDPRGAPVSGMIGKCAAMEHVFDAIQRVAPTDANVLVTGETGTGKELVARAVHELSPRARGPFVAVNCASLAEGLLESELFGHVRGAFTGAVHDKSGLFEAAAGGTLFLDEIGDVGGPLQQRLLRAIQEREVRRVGAVRSIRVDVRVIAATSRDLPKEVAEGRFRDDLFYRLNVFAIGLPPLRARQGDIPLLIQAALERADARGPWSRPFTCSPLAVRMLRGYAWPGNVRQLFAVLESAAIRADGDRIQAQHLPAEVRTGAWGARAEDPRYRADIAAADERAAILTALESAEGRRERALHILGMSRTTLWRKMRDYGITWPRQGHACEASPLEA